VILLAVRWYLRYGLSYRDLEELLTKRGIEVDHVTSIDGCSGSNACIGSIHSILMFQSDLDKADQARHLESIAMRVLGLPAVGVIDEVPTPSAG
jgi:hypothetical protein